MIKSDLRVLSWVDGALVAPGAAAIRPEDKALSGIGVFEAIKVVDGVPFALRRHLDRLVASAAPLELPIDLDRVHEGVAAVLGAMDRSEPSRRWLRITVTAGPAAMATTARAARPDRHRRNVTDGAMGADDVGRGAAMATQ